MEIRLEQVIPEPLREHDTSQSEIWGTVQTLSKGDIIRVQAPSGKGKSTFIQLLYGNRKDYSGSVFINNEQVSKFPKKKWAELRQQNLSMVFQDLRLFPEFTGWENIYLKSRLTEHYDRATIEGMAERLGVLGLFHKRAGLMSFGERQRIAIIRALVQPFDIILLDEPFSHLDDQNTAKASTLISEEVNKRGAGAVVASLNKDGFFEYTRTISL